MKKRILPLALALVMLLAFLPPYAHAEGGFADVEDAAVARNTEVLRLLGVVSGDDTGLFRPKGNLTRAEFCKMAIELQGLGSKSALYSSRTIFPDVRAEHWASGYINLSTVAGKEQPALMHGFPDGTFRPEQNISYGEAVTVLMRMLGYEDKDTSGIWPRGYFDIAAASGVTKGMNRSEEGGLLREQAAKLFVNALAVEKKSGGTLFTLGKETTLLSIDIVKGVMRTADGEETMAKPMASTLLNGLKGRVVYNSDKKALTFLPSELPGKGNGAGPVAGVAAGNAAIIVSKLGSTAGFDSLTGYSKNYTIYRNGVRATARDLRENDVATYSPESNAVFVSDTRVEAYYEDSMPSPREPVTVTVLGGTVFNVIATAQQSVAAFKPGQKMLLLLTADGQIAGALDPETAGVKANAFGYVNSSGKATMFCGGSMRELKLDGADTSAVKGQYVRIGQNEKGKILLSAQISDVRGDLDVAAGTLGNAKLAGEVIVLDNGVLTNLVALDVTRIDKSRVVYARRNSDGAVDLIVLGERSSELMGRVKVWTEATLNATETEKTGTPKYDYTDYMSIAYPGGETDKSSFVYHYIKSGDYVFAKQNQDKNLIDVEVMTKLKDVSKSAWVGTNAVNYGGRTYQIASNIMIYNLDTEKWVDSLEKALEYAGKMDLYVKDGVVYAMDIKAW